MSGTWTRRRRGPTTSTSKERPLPPSTPSTPQQQVVRSLDKMFEEAQETGVLCLSSRKLKEYPEGVSTKFNLTDLVAMDVSDNRLVEIPLVVCEYSSLETLDARENQLRRTPASISLLHALTYIDLSCNQLRDLPSSLFDLPIRIALLGGNQLESLPRMTRATANSLVHLDISYNKFRILPTDLSLLSALRILNASHNKLETFPSELCTLTLHTLDLSSNLLSALPLQLSTMRCIKRLTVVPNPLVSPPLTVVAKGREHIFKWLSVQSNREDGWRFSASGGGVATLRSFNSNSLLISSGWRDRRSGGGLTRGTTVTESTVAAEEKKENTDEGFASAPPSKASPSSYSNDSSTSASASSYSNCVPSSSSSSASDVSADFTGLLKVYDKKMASVVEKSEKEEEIGMKIEMEKKEKVERASIKRNESVRAPSHPVSRVPASTTVSHPKSTVVTRPTAAAPAPPPIISPPSAAPPPPPPHSAPSSVPPATTKQRPVSKVAPMQSSPMARSIVEKREVKGGDKKATSLLPSTASGVKGRTANGNTAITNVARSPSIARRTGAPPPPSAGSSSSSSSLTSSTRASVPIRVAPSRAANPSMTTSMVNTRRPTPSSTTRPIPPSLTAAAAVRPGSGNNNSSSPSSSASSRSNSVTTTINNNTLTKTSTMTSSVVRRASGLNGKTAPSAAPSDTVVVDRMKKMMDQRCGTSLDSLPIASLSSRLADGIILCQLAHSFHPAVCTSIALPDKNTPLASIKCKKNVEAFLDACKDLRVKSLVSCEDILGRRNLPALARMVASLSKTTADLPVSHL